MPGMLKFGGFENSCGLLAHSFRLPTDWPPSNGGKKTLTAHQPADIDLKWFFFVNIPQSYNKRTNCQRDKAKPNRPTTCNTPCKTCLGCVFCQCSCTKKTSSHLKVLHPRREPQNLQTYKNQKHHQFSKPLKVLSKQQTKTRNLSQSHQNHAPPPTPTVQPRASPCRCISCFTAGPVTFHRRPWAISGTISRASGGSLAEKCLLGLPGRMRFCCGKKPHALKLLYILYILKTYQNILELNVGM